MKLGEVCIHGSLRRSCEACDLADELNALKTLPGPPEFVEAADALVSVVKEFRQEAIVGTPTDFICIDEKLLDAIAAYEKIRGVEMSKLPKWAEVQTGHPMQNWRCKCGRTASMEHSVGGYCQARTIIERYEKALSNAWEALESVNTFSNDPQLIEKNKAAMRRIEEIGK